MPCIKPTYQMQQLKSITQNEMSNNNLVLWMSRNCLENPWLPLPCKLRGVEGSETRQEIFMTHTTKLKLFLHSYLLTSKRKPKILSLSNWKISFNVRVFFKKRKWGNEGQTAVEYEMNWRDINNSNPLTDILLFTSDLWLN